MRLLTILGVLVGVCIIALSFYLETMEYTAQIPASKLQVVTFGPDRVKVGGIWVGSVERIEREGNYFKLTVDRYNDATEALVALAGAIVACLSILWYRF